MAAELAVLDGLVVVACCKEKRVTAAPLPALELYEGRVVPLIRDRVTARGGLRPRALVLSALYRLVALPGPGRRVDREGGRADGTVVDFTVTC